MPAQTKATKKSSPQHSATATATAKPNSVNCGSWLACDGINSVYLIHQGVCIAGKPAPTEKQIFGVCKSAFAFDSTTQVGY
jgi:hypothetical protein